MNKRKIFIKLCYVLIIAMIAVFAISCYSGNQNNKAIIGQMLVNIYDNQHFALVRVQKNLENRNNMMLMYQSDQLGNLVNYNFAVGDTKQPGHLLYEGLFKEISIVCDENRTEQEREEARISAIAFAKQLIEIREKVDEFCTNELRWYQLGPPGYDKLYRQKLLNYYKLLDRHNKLYQKIEAYIYDYYLYPD